MIVNFVQRVRQFLHMKDAAQFFRDFPLELSRLHGTAALGTTEQAIQSLFALHQRFGRAVVGVIEAGLERYKAPLAHGEIAPSSLLTLVVGDQMGSDRPASAPMTAPIATASTGPIRLMIDKKRGCLSINGQPPLRGRRSVEVLLILAEQHRADTQAEHGSETFVRTARLTAALEIDRDNLSKIIERLRTRIAKALAASGHPGSDRQAVIESKPWGGYRLNPAVRLVAASA